MSSKVYHTFHIVTPSPWPLVTSIGSLGLTIGAVLSFHGFQRGTSVLLLGAAVVILTCAFWWRDVCREGYLLGDHTLAVQANLKLGMLLFIVSEVMFFSSFFWAFFHSSLAPTLEIGGVWPPVGINVFDTWRVPFLNTLILLLSGATLTWCHQAIHLDDFVGVLVSGFITLCLAILFTQLQHCEYVESTFTIYDGIYGSTFFMATGFHGFHVIIGTIFIFVSLARFYNLQFSRTHNIGFESSVWYWHFVDVVWLFLFISIYWWGNYKGEEGYLYLSFVDHYKFL